MGVIEIRWHGRGGQGVVTGSNLLARAAIYEGRYAQHFPEFGPERSGAPVRSYTRISDEPIDIHSGVYNPDIVVIIDPTMVKNIEELSAGIKKGGDVVVNYGKEESWLLDWAKRKGVKLHAVDARKISLEEINREIYNVPMLAALVRVKGLVDISTVEKVLSERFSGEVLEANLKIMRRAYEEARTLVGS